MSGQNPAPEAIEAWQKVVGSMTDAERKALPVGDALLYFPLVWLALAEVCRVANEQHNPGQPMHWAREKSTDQLNTALRHIFDDKLGLDKDPTDQCWMLAKTVWRAAAALQLKMERYASEGKPLFTGRPPDKKQEALKPQGGCLCACGEYWLSTSEAASKDLRHQYRSCYRVQDDSVVKRPGAVDHG